MPVAFQVAVGGGGCGGCGCGGGADVGLQTRGRFRASARRSHSESRRQASLALGSSNPSELPALAPASPSKEAVARALQLPGDNASASDDDELKDHLGRADRLREECGVFAVWGVKDAAKVCYFGLHSLQHRGQEGAGMVTSDRFSLYEQKGLGLVSEVFSEEKLSKLPGQAAIGHNRYSTAGEKNVKNVQPLTVDFRDGRISIAHNGNLTNYPSLRSELELRGSIFNTSSDTEVILHLMAGSVYAGRGGHSGVQRRLADAVNRVEGAYSLVVLLKDQLVVIRDPHGFRPLVMGRLGAGGVVFASETCALDTIGALYEREVDPGEMIVVSDSGVKSHFPFPRQPRRSCIFEHIYFSKPSSVVFGRNVYMSRFRFGELLSTVKPVDADVVVPVPESGLPAALGYAAASGIHLQMGIMRSHYVGRTFIQPSQSVRDVGVKLKLSPVRAVIEDRSLVVIDDSIVRGTTSRKIVRMLRESGAREVHVRIACPPITGSCYYGVDTPNRQELISFTKSVEQICEYIEADSLAFLPLEVMQDFLEDEASTFCDACFSGNYPVLSAESEAEMERDANLFPTARGDGVNKA